MLAAGLCALFIHNYELLDNQITIIIMLMIMIMIIIYNDNSHFKPKTLIYIYIISSLVPIYFYI